MKHPQLVETTQAELDAIMASARGSSSFTPGQCDLLSAVLGTYIYVMQKLQSNKLSITRLRNMLFGKSTEKMAGVEKTLAGQGAPQAQDQAGAAVKENKKQKGHGRNGAAAYLGAAHVYVGHA